MNIERVREMSPDKKWFLFANNTKGVGFYVVSFFTFTAVILFEELFSGKKTVRLIIMALP